PTSTRIVSDALMISCFFFQAEDGIRDRNVTGVQTCALPIYIDYNERVKEIIESQKTGTRKTRKDAVLVNELLVTSDRDFFEQLDPGEQKRFFEESYKLFSERY